MGKKKKNKKGKKKEPTKEEIKQIAFAIIAMFIFVGGFLILTLLYQWLNQ